MTVILQVKQNFFNKMDEITAIHSKLVHKLTVSYF